MKQQDNDLITRSKFFYQFMACRKIPLIFNLPFGASIILVLVTFILCGSKLGNINKYYFQFFVISISAIGIIFTALAFVSAIFSKDELYIVLMKGNHEFENFIMPYKWLAGLWFVLGSISLIRCLITSNLPVMCDNSINYIIIFLAFYSSSYMLYMVGDIIRFLMISVVINHMSEDDTDKKDRK